MYHLHFRSFINVTKALNWFTLLLCLNWWGELGSIVIVRVKLNGITIIGLLLFQLFHLIVFNSPLFSSSIWKNTKLSFFLCLLIKLSK
jgi:hypothetical protein